MNLKHLYDLQKNLDEKINNNHNLINEHLIAHKILALNVEVGELANETRCFKFWSLKGSSPKNVVLEEFVDCLHFILSIGIHLNFMHIEFKSLNVNNVSNNLTEAFLLLFDSISSFKNNITQEKYIYMFSQFLSLGKQLNFSTTEIEEAYLSKNNINHKRQEEGY